MLILGHPGLYTLGPATSCLDLISIILRYLLVLDITGFLVLIMSLLKLIVIFTDFLTNTLQHLAVLLQVI